MCRLRDFSCRDFLESVDPLAIGIKGVHEMHPVGRGQTISRLPDRKGEGTYVMGLLALKIRDREFEVEMRNFRRGKKAWRDDSLGTWERKPIYDFSIILP